MVRGRPEETTKQTLVNYNGVTYSNITNSGQHGRGVTTCCLVDMGAEWPHVNQGHTVHIHTYQTCPLTDWRSTSQAQSSYLCYHLRLLIQHSQTRHKCSAVLQCVGQTYTGQGNCHKNTYKLALCTHSQTRKLNITKTNTLGRRSLQIHVGSCNIQSIPVKLTGNQRSSLH